jgi:hypothetical protein
VYQAFSPEIASRAVAAQTFVPPFSLARMTWIKPSFCWMMYRSGWATKQGQECILRIEISRDGFEWALANSCLSSFDPSIHDSSEAWRAALELATVRVQWDPERSMRLDALPYRTIQVGLRAEAVRAYVTDWIVGIEDVTVLAKDVQRALKEGRDGDARLLIPREMPYWLPRQLAERIGCAMLDTRSFKP